MSTKNRVVRGHHHMWHQPPLSVRMLRGVMYTVALFVIGVPLLFIFFGWVL